MDITAIANKLGYTNKQPLCKIDVYDLLYDLMNDNNSYINKLPKEIMNEIYNNYLCKTHDIKYINYNNRDTLIKYINQYNYDEQIFLISFNNKSHKILDYLIVKFIFSNNEIVGIPIYNLNDYFSYDFLYISSYYHDGCSLRIILMIRNSDNMDFYRYDFIISEILIIPLYKLIINKNDR